MIFKTMMIRTANKVKHCTFLFKNLVKSDFWFGLDFLWLLEFSVAPFAWWSRTTTSSCPTTTSSCCPDPTCSRITRLIQAPRNTPSARDAACRAFTPRGRTRTARAWCRTASRARRSRPSCTRRSTAPTGRARWRRGSWWNFRLRGKQFVIFHIHLIWYNLTTMSNNETNQW